MTSPPRSARLLVLLLLSCLAGVVASDARASSVLDQARIVAFEDGTCVIQRDGTPRCWGDNAFGQNDIPTDLGPVTQIGLSRRVVCALPLTGTPRCWGDSGFQRNIPGDLGRVLDLGVGAFHACATQVTGAVRCWGGNNIGQTSVRGTGPFASVAAAGDDSCAIRLDGQLACWGAHTGGGAPAPPADVTTVRQVSFGYGTACVVKTDGTPRCWGSTASASTIPDGTGTVRQVVAGNGHTCVVKSNGTPGCWGRNDHGQATVPDGIGEVLALAAGDAHTCAIKVNDTVQCWGADDKGQSTVPADLGSLMGFHLALGSNHSCATPGPSSPVCWGSNALGQLDVPPVRTVIDLDGGGGSTCAVSSEGVPVCWGNNAQNQNDVPAMSATQIDAGVFHACALKSDGTPVCWTRPSSVTTVPAGTGTVRQVVAGLFTSCVVKADGTVDCWGSGPGASTPLAPALDLGPVRQLTLGFNHACAVMPASTVTCWGSDSDGQSTVPADLGPVRQVAAGAQHTCAIKIDLTVACWGRNADGQASVPGDLGPVAQLAGGLSHTCAITLAAAVRCWGANTDGQRQTIVSGTPAAVIGPAAFDFQMESTFRRDFAVTAGALPDGLSMDDLGRISGTPTKQGTYTATITAPIGGFPPSGSKDISVQVDLTAPVTTDDVPQAAQSTPTAVRLTAADTGGASVQRTTYEILAADGTVGPTTIYAADAKPVLANGERIRYRSVDTVGNAEADVTSQALVVVPPPSPTPEPTSPPAPLPTLLPQAAPAITATLGADGKGRQVLLAKKWVTVKVGCGQVACRLTMNGQIFLRGKAIATLKPVTVTLAAGERRLIRIPTTLKQRRTIRRALGPNGTKSQARFAITATTLTTPPKTATATVTVGLKQVVAKG